MKKMYANRLLKLAAFLRDLSRKQFNICRWEQDCCTVCCALGWACKIASFRRAGLHLDNGMPTFRGHIGFGAAVAFFGISQPEAAWLFAPQDYGLSVSQVVAGNDTTVTPKMVAKRIERLVAEKSRALATAA